MAGNGCKEPTRTPGTATTATDDRNRRDRLRALGARGPEQPGVSPLPLRLRAAEGRARLALVRRVQRIRRGVVHRDVRLPAHDLLPVGLAAEPLPAARSPCA